MPGRVLFLIVWGVAAQGETSVLEAFVATLMLTGMIGVFRILAEWPLLRMLLILLGLELFLSGCNDDE